MDTLVLDSGYQPVDRIHWTDAIRLIVNEKVEVLEEYADWVVRSVSRVINVPAVIRVLRSVGRRRAVRFSRNNVYLRDKGCCGYCLKPVARPEFTLDHVRPRKLGGRTCWENVVVSCHDCNQRKGSKTLEQSHMSLRRMPEKPRSLPGQTFLVKGGNIPESWQSYLRDVMYWHTELEHD